MAGESREEIDESLLDYFLELSLKERIESAARFANAIEKLRRLRSSCASAGHRLETPDGRGYRDLVQSSLLMKEEELNVRVIAVEDLIEIKASIGRDRDRAALPYLREIARRRLPR